MPAPDSRYRLFPIAALALFLAPAMPARAQTHKLTVHPNQRVVSFEMTPEEYAAWKSQDQYNDDAKRTTVVKELYRTFNDAFDFIFLVLNETSTPSNFGYAGELVSVSNAETGLGFRPFDESGDYGSAGKLKSVMALTKRTHIQNGPALHELLHTWGNFGIATAAFEDGAAVAEYRPHWGFTGGNTKGQLGGFKQSTLQTGVGGNPNRYKAEPFGQFANGGNVVPYSEMELYLMGMIPASEVTPFDVFRQVTAFDPKTYEFEAAIRVRYDAARIESEMGKRSPSSLASQKAFRLLIVVLCGAPLTETEWSGFDKDAERFGRAGDEGTEFYNFWEATNGRGTLETGNLGGALKSAGILPLNRSARSGLAAADGFFDLSGRKMEPWRGFRSHAARIPFRLRAD